MLAGDSFVFEEYQILGNQKLLPHPKTDASILLNISQLPSNGKFQTKLHSQKVTNLAPENRPTLTFQGLLLSHSRDGSNWRTQAVLLVSLVSPPHDAAKEHLGGWKSESFNWVLLLMFFVLVEFGC